MAKATTMSKSAIDSLMPKSRCSKDLTLSIKGLISYKHEQAPENGSTFGQGDAGCSISRANGKYER
eukprot:4915884-Pleurochrysis_carterae.AAC.4